ncbi:MAG TPA: hypothetical protein VFN11_14010 [Ktedonobacterales bacterium]|nr:hypothetical protein [Ktedonobacterales bacterium]
MAAEQIRSWLAQAGPQSTGPQNTGPQNTGPQNTGPIVTFDAGYDAVQLRLARADLQVGLLVRLRAGRCFYADPTAQPATGRPRRHGARVRL